MRNKFIQIKGGCTRHAILIGKYVIKIPRLNYGWYNFLKGLLGNMQEVNISNTKDERVSKVLFSVAGGILLVMNRCSPLSLEDYNELLNIDLFWEQKFKRIGNDIIYYGDCKIPVEHKMDSFGWYKGKIVAIDYGS